MATTIKLDPVTRIEGHLEIEVTIDNIGGAPQVVDAKCIGTMFRGFEIILAGRDPRDAIPYTQRICGVCPVSHATASSLALDSALSVTPPDNGRILRNLVLGANFIQSHILHFYHLTALDYVDTSGILTDSPWTPRYVTADMVGGSTAQALVNNYLQALRVRRKSHQMGAIFAGKLPCIASFAAGGCTETPTDDKIADFRTLLTEIRSFIDNSFIPDVTTLIGYFPTYYSIGTGHGNLLAFGAFEQSAGGKLLPGGRYTGGSLLSTNEAAITEDVTASWFTPQCGKKHPSVGETIPDRDKAGAYTWLKAPRYADVPYELGPLARMWIAGEYTNGISVLDRLMARALETKKIADAMDSWLDELTPGASGITASSLPQQALAIGLTEAPRGALGHWMSVDGGLISRYQVITPTGWNASPRDELGQRGPLEAALIGTPTADTSKPVEVLRVIHSFDPCLACAVHMIRPDSQRIAGSVIVQPGIS